MNVSMSRKNLWVKIDYFKIRYFFDPISKNDRQRGWL